MTTHEHETMRTTIHNETWIRSAAVFHLGATWQNATEARKDAFVDKMLSLVIAAGLCDADTRSLVYGWRAYSDVERNGWHCQGRFLTHSRFPGARR